MIIVKSLNFLNVIDIVKYGILIKVIWVIVIVMKFISWLRKGFEFEI